jgi:hypothetical protein
VLENAAFGLQPYSLSMLLFFWNVHYKTTESINGLQLEHQSWAAG